MATTEADATAIAALIGHMPIGVVLLDAELRVVFANAAFAALAGVRPEEIKGRSLAELLPAFAASFGFGAATVLQTGAAVVDLQVAAGEQRFLVSCFPAAAGVGLTLQLRPAGDEEGRTLLDREAMFRAAFESAAVGMVVADWGGGGMRANRALLSMMGYSEAEFARAGVQGITHPDDWEKDLTEFQRLLAGEIDHYEIEKRYLRRDAGVMSGRLSVSVARDKERRPVFLIAIIEDVTEQKRSIVALEQTVRAREVFLAVASHELRTPLTPLKLQLQLLGHRLGESHELTVALRQVERLTALVETLLDISRAATGRLTLQEEPIDLAECAHDVVERFRAQAVAKKSPIQLKVGPGYPSTPTVCASRRC